MRRNRNSPQTTSPLRTLIAAATACAVVHMALSATLTSHAAPHVDHLEVAPIASTPAPSVPQDETGSVAKKEFRSPETVLQDEPYQPVFPGWSKRIYPLPADQVPADPRSCVAWRQTGSCDPDGPREAFFDLPCTASVPSGRSGYCECGNLAKRAKQKCAAYDPFRCADVCASDFDGESSEDYETLEKKLDTEGHVVVEGRLVRKRKALENDVKKAQQQAVHQKKQRNKRKLLFHRLVDQLAPRANPTDPPVYAGATGCVGFQQTHDCSPFGPIESNQRACDAVIPSGVSGYCMCAGGYHGPGVSCDHVPFTCVDGCDPKMAEQLDEMLLGGEKAHAESSSGALPTTADEAAEVNAAAIAMAKNRDTALLTFGNGAPVRALDRVALTPEDSEEIARLQHEAHDRAAEVEQLNQARRRAEPDTARPLVAGGGPAILGDHEAFDADVSHALAQAVGQHEQQAAVPNTDNGLKSIQRHVLSNEQSSKNSFSSLDDDDSFDDDLLRDHMGMERSAKRQLRLSSNLKDKGPRFQSPQ